MRKRSKMSAKGISANFWLIGLYYGALCPLQDRSDCSAHGGLRADVQSIFRWGFRLGFQTGRTSGLAGNSNSIPGLDDSNYLYQGGYFCALLTSYRGKFSQKWEEKLEV